MNRRINRKEGEDVYVVSPPENSIDFVDYFMRLVGRLRSKNSQTAVPSSRREKPICSGSGGRARDPGSSSQSKTRLF